MKCDNFAERDPTFAVTEVIGIKRPGAIAGPARKATAIATTLLKDDRVNFIGCSSHTANVDRVGSSNT